MEDSLEDFIKVTRNTKQSHKTETSAANKISQPENITARRKIECESRAAKIVEFLIEGKLRPEVFMRCLKHLNQSYYQDVVEERAIGKVCGYSLCGNEIPSMPSKQFFIDTKCNKVYDLTERKNYCSNFCYCASLHIKLQIDNSPLWLRKLNESPKFTLLADTEKGSPGEEVNQHIAKPLKEPSFTSISSFAVVSLEDINNDEIKTMHKHADKTKQTLQTLDEVNDLQESDKPTDAVPCSSDKSNKNDKLTCPVNKQSIKISQKHYSSKKDFKNIFINIKKYVGEWMTLETYIFLYGEEQIKCHVDENHLQQYFASLKLVESSTVQQKKYVEICKKLHFNQLVEDAFDKSVLGFKVEPIPDYKQLKEDSHNIELKVRSFYAGDTYEVDAIKIKDSTQNIISQQDEDVSSNNPAVLPLVDVNSQNALRRKIYLTSISKAMLALTQGLHIPSQHILEELNFLVKTFKLNAHNVIFEPFLWSIIALILIKMLSIRDENLKIQLDSRQSKMFINAMLNQLPNANVFFEELFLNIENIDLFLQEYFNADN